MRLQSPVISYVMLIDSYKDRSSGLLPAVDYDGIDASLVQWQDCLTLLRRGVKHTERAIQAGLRDAELFPALLRDYRVWMFMRPDMCVSASM